MGSCSPKIFKKEEAQILILGLDCAGKTTLLYWLKLNQQLTTIPTVGFNVENVDAPRRMIFSMWDVGGQEKIRFLWKHYFANTDALLYVVDCSDRDRVSLACDELHSAMGNEAMWGVPVLVAANKQDLPDAMKAEELTEKLNLHELKETWQIQETCLTKPEGLQELMDILTTMVRERRKETQLFRK